MANVDYNIRNQVIDLTTSKTLPVVDNLYKESLRGMLNLMGDIYYIDGNNNKVKIKCVYGNPERMVSRLMADNTMELPLISVSEVSTANAENRRRHSHIIISKKEWNPKTRRATRVVSLAPRPVNITYEVNIWVKYNSDMDMIRSAIFSMFNPDVDVKTKFSDYNKAFLVEERDLGSLNAEDTDDRVIQKSITISLETYIDYPKFKVTSTGEIKDYVFEVTIGEEGRRDTTIEYPVSVGSDGLIADQAEVAQLPQRLDLAVELLLSIAATFTGVAATLSLGNVDLTTSALALSLENGLSLGTLNVETSALTLVSEGGINLASVDLTTSAIDLGLQSDLSVGNVDLITSALTLVSEGGLNLDSVDLETSALALSSTATSNLVFNSDPLELVLTNAFSYAAAGQINAGTLDLVTSASDLQLDDSINLAFVDVSTTVGGLSLVDSVNLDNLDVSTSIESLGIDDGINLENVSLSATVNATFTATSDTDEVINLGTVSAILTVDGYFDGASNPDTTFDTSINLSNIVVTMTAPTMVISSDMNVLIPLDASGSPDF